MAKTTADYLNCEVRCRTDDKKINNRFEFRYFEVVFIKLEAALVLSRV